MHDASHTLIKYGRIGLLNSFCVAHSPHTFKVHAHAPRGRCPLVPSPRVGSSRADESRAWRTGQPRNPPDNSRYLLCMRCNTSRNVHSQACNISRNISTSKIAQTHKVTGLLTPAPGYALTRPLLPAPRPAHLLIHHHPRPKCASLPKPPPLWWSVRGRSEWKYGRGPAWARCCTNLNLSSTSFLSQKQNKYLTYDL